MTELNGIVLSRLPVLPLRGLTAFPNMIVHFDVGRMMSIRALEAAMKNGQTIFLTAQRELKTDTPTPSDLYQIGTICPDSPDPASAGRQYPRAGRGQDPVRSRTTLSPPKRTRTACMPRLRNSRTTFTA